MPVKIRLQRQGKKKAPWFSIVVANSRSPRDGKYIERLGTYDPTTIPATIDINNDKAFTWMTKGAQPTDTVRAILSYKGVMYKKHLQRGVDKKALTQEQADVLYTEFTAKKEDQVKRKKEEQLNKKKRLKEGVRADEVKKREKMETARKPVVEEAPAAVAEVAESPEIIEAPVAEAPTPETPSETQE